METASQGLLGCSDFCLVPCSYQGTSAPSPVPSPGCPEGPTRRSSLPPLRAGHAWGRAPSLPALARQGASEPISAHSSRRLKDRRRKPRREKATRSPYKEHCPPRRAHTAAHAVSVTAVLASTGEGLDATAGPECS